MLHQATLGESSPNRLVSEFSSRRPHDNSTRLKAAMCQGDVGGNDNVSCLHSRSNPIIGDVWTLFDDHELDHLAPGDANATIGDDKDLHIVALRDSIHFFLHRASVSVNEYSYDHSTSSPELLDVTFLVNWQPPH